jgi:hypothetical protein
MYTSIKAIDIDPANICKYISLINTDVNSVNTRRIIANRQVQAVVPIKKPLRYRKELTGGMNVRSSDI